MRLLNDGTNELDDFNNSFNGFNNRKRRRRKPMPRPKVKYTMYDYIAERSPADSHILINKFGKYRRARNPEELAGQLKDFVRTFGDKGLIELAKIHPDRDLIELECRGCKEHKRKKEVRERVVYSNADGNGNNGTSNMLLSEQRDSRDKMLIFAGLIMFGLIITRK